MSITDRLNEIQKRAENRTGLGCANCRFPDENADGKWWRCTICGSDEYETDVPAVADAQTLALVAALRAVLSVLDRELAEPYNPESERLAQRARTAVTDALGVSS